MGGRSKDRDGRRADRAGPVERLYRSPFRESLIRTAMAIYPSSLGAEDIVQEVFIAEWNWRPAMQEDIRGGGTDAD